jgi:hypothetical protein
MTCSPNKRIDRIKFSWTFQPGARAFQVVHVADGLPKIASNNRLAGRWRCSEPTLSMRQRGR